MMEINREHKKVFKVNVRKVVRNIKGNINDMWNRIATCVKSTAKEIVEELQLCTRKQRNVGIRKFRELYVVKKQLPRRTVS